MSKKLNSFILPDEVVKEMRIKLRKGLLKEIELGFSLCSVLKVGEQCTGGVQSARHLHAKEMIYR